MKNLIARYGLWTCIEFAIITTLFLFVCGVFAFVYVEYREQPTSNSVIEGGVR